MIPDALCTTGTQYVEVGVQVSLTSDGDQMRLQKCLNF